LNQELARARAKPRPDGRIAIGFASTLLRTHTIGRLNLGLIRGLDRERFHVSVLGPEHAGDPLADEIRRNADQVVVLPRNLRAAREAIAAAELHVLYYPDIGMDPLTYFLAYARLAPLQVVSWGHPDTTGLTSIDFFISADAMEPRQSDRHYTERLARLAGPTVSIARPVRSAPFGTRASLGLPDEATLYVCPQSLFKLHPAFDPVLQRILEGDPKGRLVLIHGKDRNWADLLLARLGADAARRTIVLPILSSKDFIELLAAADVMLDPMHYSGGHTSLEALALGLPIVTWPGRFMRARHTFGFYRLMGYEDLVAGDEERYVELALSLGRDQTLRSAARRRILESNAVLFDNGRTIAGIGEFLEAALAARW
jgi:predicted O-linked N-acetylglucosamine transferase (SPINDLY family)